MVTVIDPDIIDFANLSTMITNIGDLFPGIIALILALLPLIFIGMILGLLVGMFDGVIEMIKNFTSFRKP